MARSGLLRRLFTASMAVLFGLAALATAANAQTKGGVLRVGNLGEPPALDPHWTTASITETLTNHIYEGLYSLDSSNKPIPMLAEGVTISKDGLVYTFKLRQGVKFHNGKEMTLKEKSAIVLISLAIPSSFAAIYPKEIAEKFPPEVKATEYIGTGPYKLAEWRPDQYIRMVRFDEYKSRNEAPNGYG